MYRTTGAEGQPEPSLLKVLECELCGWCQPSICWPLLREPIMGTNPIGHYHGRLTFIGCCCHCTDQQKPSPGWSKCGRAFMDMDKIDPSDISQTWGEAATITAKMELVFEEPRFGIVVWEENQRPTGAAHKAPSTGILEPFHSLSMLLCLLSQPRSGTASIKPATLMSGPNRAHTACCIDYSVALFHTQHTHTHRRTHPLI